jgi:hypothetical protein
MLGTDGIDPFFACEFGLDFLAGKSVHTVSYGDDIAFASRSWRTNRVIRAREDGASRACDGPTGAAPTGFSFSVSPIR